MGFVSELIAGDRKREHEASMKEMDMQADSEWREYLKEQNALQHEENKQLFDFADGQNAEAAEYESYIASVGEGRDYDFSTSGDQGHSSPYSGGNGCGCGDGQDGMPSGNSEWGHGHEQYLDQIQGNSGDRPNGYDYRNDFRQDDGTSDLENTDGMDLPGPRTYAFDMAGADNDVAGTEDPDATSPKNGEFVDLDKPATNETAQQSADDSNDPKAEEPTVEKNKEKLGDLETQAAETKAEIQKQVDAGELTQEQAAAYTGKLDAQIKDLKDGIEDTDNVAETSDKLDKATKEAEGVARNVERIDDLKQQVEDNATKIDNRVASGDLTQAEGDALKADATQKAEQFKADSLDPSKSAEDTSASYDKANAEMDARERNLDKFDELDERAADTNAEIDARLEKGDLTQQEADALKADVAKDVDALKADIKDPEKSAVETEKAVDTGLKELEARERNLEKTNDLDTRLTEFNSDIDNRVTSGELTKDEGDALKADAKTDTDTLKADLKDPEKSALQTEADIEKTAKDQDARTGNLDKLRDLNENATSMKADIDKQLKNGEISEETANAQKAGIDEKLADARKATLDPETSAEETSAKLDDAPKDLEAARDKPEQIEKLDKRTEDVRTEINERAEKGEISKEAQEAALKRLDEQHAAAKAALDDPEKSPEERKVDYDKALGTIDKMDNDLNRLADLDKRADDVNAEIDTLLKNGQLSQQGADQARADIKENVRDTEDALLDPRNSTQEAEAESMLKDTTNKINAMDNNLNEVAKADAIGDTKRAEVRDSNLPAGEEAKRLDRINNLQRDAEVHYLEWA